MANIMVCSHQPIMYDAENACYPSQATNNAAFKSMFKPTDLHREFSRRKTFLLWSPTADANPDDLAAAGFYFTGSDDTCQCFSCGLRLRNWSISDHPLSVHDKHSPRCDFIQGGSSSKNVPLEDDSDIPEGEQFTSGKPRPKRAGSIEADGDGSTGRRPQRGARRTNKTGNDLMKSRKARLASFKGKWRKSEIVTPEELADAGFYYGKDKDRAICAYCSVKLVGWKQGDTPYGEHFKHSPACQFLTGQIVEEQEEEFMSSDLYFKDDAASEETVTSNEAIETAKGFGFSEMIIQRALLRLQKKAPNTLGVSANALLDAIYEVQDNLGGDNNTVSESCASPVTDGKVDKTEDPEVVKLKEENTRLKMRCHSCHQNKADTLLLPCRHLVSCDLCSPKLKKCPKCKGEVKGVVKTYFA